MGEAKGQEWKGIGKLNREITGELSLAEQYKLLRSRLEPLLEAADNVKSMIAEPGRTLAIEQLKEELTTWR